MDLFSFWNQNLAFTAAQTSIPCYRTTKTKDGSMLLNSKKQAKTRLFLAEKMHRSQLS